MFSAELAIVRAEHPAWSIRRVDHGRGWSGQRGESGALVGRTLGDLAGQITEHGAAAGK